MKGLRSFGEVKHQTPVPRIWQSICPHPLVKCKHLNSSFERKAEVKFWERQGLVGEKRTVPDERPFGKRDT